MYFLESQYLSNCTLFFSQILVYPLKFQQILLYPLEFQQLSLYPLEFSNDILNKGSHIFFLKRPDIGMQIRLLKFQDSQLRMRMNTKPNCSKNETETEKNDIFVD